MYHLVKSIYLHATSLPEYSILLLGLDAAGKTTLHNQIKALYNSSSPAADAAAHSSSSSSQSGAPGQPSSSAGKTVPTVGQNVSVVSLPDLYLRIWDVGGQHTLRGLWHNYYSSCHAIIFVVDSTDIGDADISKLPARSSFSTPSSAVGGSSSSTTNGTAASSQDPNDTSNGTGFSRSNLTAALAAESHTGSRLAECRLVLESILSSAEAEGVPLLVLANKQDREDSVEVVRIKEGFVRRVVEGDKGGSVRDSRVLPCSALTGTGVKEAVEWVGSRVKWNRDARPPVMR